MQLLQPWISDGASFPLDRLFFRHTDPDMSFQASSDTSGRTKTKRDPISARLFARNWFGLSNQAWIDPQGLDAGAQFIKMEGFAEEVFDSMPCEGSIDTLLAISASDYHP